MLQFDDISSTFEVKRYIELLAKVCDSVTKPFGYEIDSHEGEMTQFT